VNRAGSHCDVAIARLRPQGGRRRAGPRRTARQFAGRATARLGAHGWRLPLRSRSRSRGQVDPWRL